ncbi:hypothetical protein M8C21_001864 [Ambrosia artemisiifolia]|uniref:Uncharacterized protein n=1 Tax=Ambrosia artemisiifolia TaxID=4212 RepID=A0AAD5GQF5_AMBAR|nr:hypothetical protein M8C21_001864 [Ambrosia artemisiifolia]
MEFAHRSGGIIRRCRRSYRRPLFNLP